MTNPYPSERKDRGAWILRHRPERLPVDVRRPHTFFVEQERSASGEIVDVATLFLTNRECPWRCVMCDLWRHTVTEALPPGVIPQQVDYALQQMALSPPARPLRQIKLYNSGSFFDAGAIPRADYRAIGRRIHSFERVIVESHPALIGPAVLAFREVLPSPSVLEVALGLETAHPEVLAKLNKGVTLEQFAHAAAFLRDHGIALRVFILVQPPFMAESEALVWTERSLNFAFDRGATVATLIPTRAGNGSLEALAHQGLFAPPRLSMLEAALKYGIELRRGRVLADLWDLEKFSDCAACFAARRDRLREMNLRQSVPPAIECGRCVAVTR